MTVGGYPDRNIVLCVGAIMVVAALAFWELLGVIIIAGTLAVVLLPIQRFLTRKINPFISSFLIASLVVLIASSAIGFTIAIFYTHADYISYLIDTILTWFGAIGAAGTPTISQTEMNDWIILQLDTLSAWSTSLVYQAPMILVKILIFLMALMAFLYKSDEIYTELIGVLPGRLSSACVEVSKVAVDTLYAIYVVHIITAIITFLLAVPFFYFLGYDYVLFYATLAALFQLVPILGPSLLMVFLGIYAVSIGDLRSAALIAIIGYPIVCAMPDLLFRPLIMGMRAKLNPLLMWIGFFGGLAVMGLIGFILGPLFIALVAAGYAVLIRELRTAKEQEMMG
ncbi:MAG: AI-2E family transporter [Methanocalculus sp.]|uniref:AI-2E family transporter n=1 Tax=Methanocalculus sp. TaxID=2004547 RepID=UPI002723F2ED|nr:AI-2E family transporter [Methanocalculus sp.]MDO8842289.1 AI-2E family transporter [Methanocalculus sp.]MDO9540504.1 AI-2E family transporter [Methanocalculus sp.]